ncbi:unnamed protein product, partial [Rotaria sp. Silwood2]
MTYILYTVPAGDLLKPIKAVTDSIVAKLNEREQKREFYNISTLGNFEELQRAASDTAALLTLYYKEQIERIKTSQKIEGSNVFNDKVHWIKEVLIDVRPESKEEKAIIIVAEYVTAWLIDALKTAKASGIVSDIPLSEQLWHYAAKHNPMEQGKIAALTDIIGAAAGRQLIPLRITNSKGRQYQVKLQHLIGYVCVISNEGIVYQYPVSSNDLQKDNYPDLTLFGYVYLTPFTADRKICESIIKGRQLISTHRKADGDILTKVEKIRHMIESSQGINNGVPSVKMSETAFQVAKVLREQNSFVDSSYVQAKLEKSRINIEYSIAILREEIQENATRYQTSMEVAHDLVKRESDQARIV